MHSLCLPVTPVRRALSSFWRKPESQRYYSEIPGQARNDISRNGMTIFSSSLIYSPFWRRLESQQYYSGIPGQARNDSRDSGSGPE